MLSYVAPVMIPTVNPTDLHDPTPPGILLFAWVTPVQGPYLQSKCFGDWFLILSLRLIAIYIKYFYIQMLI